MEHQDMPKKNFLSLQMDPQLFKPASDEEKAQQLTQRKSPSCGTPWAGWAATKWP